MATGFASPARRSRSGRKSILVGAISILVGANAIHVGAISILVGANSILVGAISILVGANSMHVGANSIHVGAPTSVRELAPTRRLQITSLILRHSGGQSPVCPMLSLAVLPAACRRLTV